MSDVETYTGTLKPIDREGKSFEEWFRSQPEVGELPSYFLNWREYFGEWCYDNKKDYFYMDSTDELFEVDKQELDTEDFSVSRRNPDGSYSFAISFYNGGCSLDEALTEAVEGAESASEEPSALLGSTETGAELAASIELGILAEEDSSEASVKPGDLTPQQIQWLGSWLAGEGWIRATSN